MRRPLLVGGVFLAACAVAVLIWFLCRESEPVLPSISVAGENVGSGIPHGNPLEPSHTPRTETGAEPCASAAVDEPVQPEAEPATAPPADEPLRWKDQLIERYTEPREPKYLVTLRGDVVDIAGRPVAGASVTVAGAVSSDKYRTMVGRSLLAITGRDGRFEGTYALRRNALFELTLFARLRDRESEKVQLTVRAGDTYDGILFRLPECGSVSGLVVNDAQEPITRVIVSVRLKHRTPTETQPEDILRELPRAALTSADGRFTISDIKPGDYILTARASGFQKATQEVTVLAGVNTELAVPIILPAATCVRLKLVSTGFQPAGKFTATFFRDDGSHEVKSATAGRDGRALIDDVPQDATGLIITMAGFQPTERIAVKPVQGAQTDLGEITLQPATEGK